MPLFPFLFTERCLAGCITFIAMKEETVIDLTIMLIIDKHKLLQIQIQNNALQHPQHIDFKKQYVKDTIPIFYLF